MIAVDWRSLPVMIACALCACSSDHAACSPDAECGSDQACVIGRCRPATASAVSPETMRVVLQARDVAVLSSRDGVPTDARVAPLGSSASGDVIVLLAFDADVTTAVDVDGAYLVVEAEVSSPGPAAPISIDVVPILSEWRSNGVSWGRSPTLGLSLGSARIQPARRAPLRVDVTEIVAKQRGIGHGLALVASGADPIGARLITLARSSNGPKLELYLKQSPSRAAAIARARAARSASASPQTSSSASAQPSASAAPKASASSAASSRP